MAAPDPSPNPFPGLRPFEFDENHLFFGRDGQTDELLARLRRFHFLAVVGTSGSGKSSLVRAGLLPDIYGGLMVGAGSAWRVALFKPGNDPVGNLARALSAPEAFGEEGGKAPIIESTLRRSALGLVEAVRQERAPGNLLVVADQFEEVFRFQEVSDARHPEDEAAAFVRLLLEAARQSEQSIYVVLTMRSDYLGDCAQFGGLPEAINEGLYLIPRMTREQRREAITGPVAVGGGAIAPRLVNRLLNDVGDNPDQLPLLQHALMRMWDCWQTGAPAGAIDLEHYERIGTLTGALNQQADEAFAELTPRGQELAPRIFKRLTEKGADNREVRRPATVAELAEVSGAGVAEVVAVIEVFRAPGRSFLMPPVGRVLAPDSSVDISHESLIRGWSRLRAWVEEEAASAEMYHRLAETAELHAAGQAGLWRDPDLQLALDWRTRNAPTETWARRYQADFARALAFLEQSQAAEKRARAAEERDRRQRRLLRHGVIAALAIGCIVSWIFASQARVARKKAERAEAKALAGERSARSEQLRVRRQNLDKFAFVTMAERLVELTVPEEAALWQSSKANALSWLQKHDEATQTYEAILEQNPDDAAAHFSLGYHYLVAGKVAPSLEHTERALAADPNSWVGHQNRAIALAGLGRFHEAQKALAKADETFHPEGIEFLETVLAPDIPKATGRTVLLVEDAAVHEASAAAMANFQAFEGVAGFEEAVRAVHRSEHQVETYLTAINWCWLQLKFRPQDYGALAAQGAWWEGAGYKPWARRVFLEFSQRHEQARDPRYAELSRWVAGRLRALQDEKLPEPASDPDTLVFDAWDHENSGEWEEAQACLDRVVALRPKNVQYLLMRAAFDARRAWKLESEGKPENAFWYAASVADTNAVLEQAPNSANAYSYRAYAKQGLRAPNEEVIADLRKVLEISPLDAQAMRRLSSLVRWSAPAEALALLERALTANIGYFDLPHVHAEIAEIYQDQEKPEAALASLEKAIAIKNDQAKWYETRARLEQALGRPAPEIQERLAAGLRVVGDIEMKRAKKSEAFQAYWQSLEAVLTSAAPPSPAALAAAFEPVSRTIIRLGSRARALEFWSVAAATERFAGWQEAIAVERARLEALPAAERTR